MEEKLVEFYSSMQATERGFVGSYIFNVESHVLPSTGKTLQLPAKARHLQWAHGCEALLEGAPYHGAWRDGLSQWPASAFPWLGASPDALVFDPAEGSYGVLETKCPYTLRDKKGEELASSSFCSKLTENGPWLQRDHSYYVQIIGQMGVSGLSWGDFAVDGKGFILIKRLRLSSAESETKKNQLNYFILIPFCCFWRVVVTRLRFSAQAFMLMCGTL